MKHLLTICLFVLSSLTVLAGDYDYIVIEATNGTVTAFTSDGISISFTSGTTTTINVTPSGGSTSQFNAADTKSMYFSSSSTGIENVLAKYLDSEAVEVYNINGNAQGKFESVSDALSKLPKGIYIFKGKTKTFKLITK